MMILPSCLLAALFAISSHALNYHPTVKSTVCTENEMRMSELSDSSEENFADTMEMQNLSRSQQRFEAVHWARHNGTRNMFRGRQCAVVGSGAGLHGEAYGAEIDKHDVVIRVNRLPPRDGSLARKIGKRTDVYFLDSCEPSSNLRVRFVGGEPGLCNTAHDHDCDFGALILRGNTERFKSPKCVGETKRKKYFLHEAAKSRIPWGIVTDVVTDAALDMTEPHYPSSGFHAAIVMALECKSVRLYGFVGTETVDGHPIVGHDLELEHKKLSMLMHSGLQALPPALQGVIPAAWPATNVSALARSGWHHVKVVC
eukprot:gnl/TRDRNA2_/TRDRNA2_35344_c0_seq1.p1 gnl/TRDRNA2_/TRDRNA2_35344_c0~~gnl/TRDRNA2_/TRDRNA2_35344_c0_seq1.p1  ORF type:complete len:313 (-),score=17.27 gnl/TRDRNA2_/TRDRNA2_35344_c0_seq1:22-960(-)